MEQKGQRPEPRRVGDERPVEGQRPELVEGLWVTQALGGDQNAFACLVGAYKVPVYNLCCRMLGNAAEAEDAAQETFVRVYTRLKTYNRQQRLSSWILAVASHYCIDRLRRRRINWLSLGEVPPLKLLSTDEVQPEDVAVGRESRQEITSLLQTLSAEYRMVIILRYWQDLSYAEMAEVLDTTESAIKSRLHRARKTLAQQVMAQRKPETRPGGKVQQRKRMAENALL
jgi:RNA polymerase sigma-70 factor (ECF subfamily)